MTSIPPPSSIRSQSDLTAMWQALPTPERAEHPSVSLAFIDETGDRPPALFYVDGVPPHPAPADGEYFARLVEQVREQAGAGVVAAALVRGGDDRVDDSDRAWARVLAEHAGLTAQWPLHLVTPTGARVLAADDLLG
ncbi:MAG: hypothetical protein ACTHN8_09365 [Angustibacter sp.]